MKNSEPLILLFKITDKTNGIITPNKDVDIANTNVLKNIFPNNGYPQPLMNGTVGYITAIRKTKLDTINPYMDVDFAVDYNMNMVYSVRIDLNPFYGRAEYVNKYNGKEIPRCEFDFGYAITVHKSQGSEYDKVLVYAADGWGDLKKLYYTAATRASKKLVWVK